MIDPHEAPVCNRADPCHICYVTKQSPHPYYLKIRPCNAHVDRHRWEILDNEGLLQTSAESFATEREDNGRLTDRRLHSEETQGRVPSVIFVEFREAEPRPIVRHFAGLA